MDKAAFDEFLTSSDTLRIYEGDRLVFSSEKDRLLPLLDYLSQPSLGESIVVMDKIMGNAAALLSVRAGCQEVASPLGSELAIKTLDRYDIKYHLLEIVPYIQREDGKGICPMENLSIDKGPEEFFAALMNMVKGQK